MLKRLELVGFKSFADKTQFDFPPGVTGIVGPNGSGKSNVVDAVRWVLGEQSARSLRGGEMADVIFNGSASRRALGLAEVSLLFDNSRRTLASEAAEVLIARRVYRSGESEYLLNGQICRLRDIKDLFLGSGAGTDAYCIIQQGQVDVLLQASTKERRTIFEEAAGISRFKAKKLETLRRLERVDSNLQRLKDIIDEVEKQLRGVKLQASKAQRYQEYSGQLRELRVGLGLQEFAALSGRLDTESAALAELRFALERYGADAVAGEAEAARLEEAVARLDAAVRERDGLLAVARQVIATGHQTLEHERQVSADLEAELSRTRSALADLTARIASLTAEAGAAAVAVGEADIACQQQRRGIVAVQDELQNVILKLGLLHNQTEADRAAQFDQVQLTSKLRNDAVLARAQADRLRREHDRLRLKTEQAAEHLASLDVELEELVAAAEGVQSRLAAARRGLADGRQEREQLGELFETTARAVADLREERSGLTSRVAVLERLERSHEGLGAGVREVVAHLEKPDPGPWRAILGLTADLLTVRREFAPLIDVALGERAQRFLVRDPAQFAAALRELREPFSGRVSFMPLPSGPTEPRPAEASDTPAAPTSRALRALGRERRPLAPPPEGTPNHPGIVAAAQQWVSCDHPELAELPARLLARTLIVHDLDAARAVAALAPGHRLVTLQGELLEPDGTLTIGAHHAETGILSRKSELRELREQVELLDERIVEAEYDLAQLRERLAALDAGAAALQQEINLLAEQDADLRTRLGERRQKRDALHEDVATNRSEISGIETDIGDEEGKWQYASGQAEVAERRVAELLARLARADEEQRALEASRDSLQAQCMAAKEALARADERLKALRTRQVQLDADLVQRRGERERAAGRLTEALTRSAESIAAMLDAQSALAHGYLDKESAAVRLESLTAERDRHRAERETLAERTRDARAAWRELQGQAHERELVVSDLRHRREALSDRLREDYTLTFQRSVEDGSVAAVGADGMALTILPIEEERKAAVEEEVAELRRKLARLGSVNLDSLQELAELEARAEALQTQYDDLTAAKRALEEIIARINQDSQRLFAETFAAIRGNFQELFRKLFGGGMADIVLEDENDVLECGIEIVARPPGKELRSISLMSGGEKTMTAVALLLAIFRSKPSPFCILDEVDAALDEANVGRFTAVLKEFMDRSQFIIITHSKRTMAATDVLYGITMQEAGISKRVAVKFEDWPDEGSLPLSAAA